MKNSLYLFSVLLILIMFTAHFKLYMAYADDATSVKSGKSNSDNRQIEPAPEPAEATNLNSSKSNVNRDQTQPAPEPVEGKTVKGSKSNTSE